MELVANFILNNDSLNAQFDVSEVDNFDALFEIYASGTTWGSIAGDISNQIDLQDALNELSGNIGELETTVNNNNTQINNRVDGIVDSFDDDIEGLQTQITNLSDTVSSNYTTLDTKIDNVDTRLQGDISALRTDVNTNTDDISALDTAVSNLNTTVQSNYTILDTKIDNVETGLQNNIDTLSGTVTSNYNSLTQSITSNVSTLNTRITNEVTTLNTAIGTETTTRQTADNDLQSQIDAIVLSSDVFDIVGTYAELQAYDITTVPVNDIIKVLVDSTHGNAATYYRCTETGGVKSWSYIGSEGAYYTKAEADGLFVEQTTTINGKALSSNITLTASDVGALPSSTQIGNGTITLTQGGTQKGVFTLNQTGNATIDFDAGGSTITVDAVLSTSSTNPVQNKVITTELNKKLESITSSDVTSALGYTPYNSTNPDGYITSSALTPYVLSSSLASVATSGSYNDLSNKPTIPTVNNATLTIQKNGTNVETFTANASSNKTANIIVPTKTSDLTNDSNFATTSQIPTNNNQLINGAGYITGITSSDVTTALGYTPYDSTNPNGYTSNVGTVTSVNNVQPVNGNVTLTIPDPLPSQTGQSGKYLTTDGTDASWGDLSTRNIGEIVASTIPLTDAGLHLLDGTLINGNGIYSNFVNYIASKIEYNSNAFTIIGNPNITEDGIGSGFNASNYLSMPFDSSLINFRFEFNFTTSDTVIENYILGGDATSEKRILAFVNVYGVSASIYKADGTNLTLSSNLHGGISANTKYLGYIEYDGTKYTIGIKTEQESNWTTNEVTSSFVSDLSNIYIKPFGGGNNNFSVDLKGYSASTDGITIFSGITPSCFTNEATWQQCVAKYGACGKFVYDPVANTVRLPRIEGFTESTINPTNLGDLTEAGLPNITGSITGTYTSGVVSGAFETVRSSGNRGTGSSTVAEITLDASNSNSIYGNSTTVQPQTIKTLIYIVVATTTKTQIEVDIDEIATDLNGKADRDGSNMVSSVKNFDGQWVYTQLSIATSVTAPTTTSLTYSLSTYLPNDGYNYEVLFSASCITGNTSGNLTYVMLGTDLQPNEFLVALARTRTSSTMASAGSCIIAVGIDREVIIKPHTNNTGLISLAACGYRRIGTNS